MNKEELNEFIRRLGAEGLSYSAASEKSGMVTAKNGMSASFNDDGTIQYNKESRPLAIRISQIYYQVREYMPALQGARLDVASLDWENKAQTLLKFNNSELAASLFSDNNIGFITWGFDRDGERDEPHVFTDYARAKQDFAVRAELIPHYMLFSEKQLALIRSRLCDYLALQEPPVARQHKDAIREVIDKINNVIFPKIYEREEEEEMDNEQEDEL